MRTWLMLALLVLPVGAAELTVGRAAVKITPPLGMPMAGYYYVRGAEGVHDDLYAKAMVLEKDGVKAALVACDLIAMTETLAGESRALIASATGIPAERVMISATHAHTGPELPGRSGRERFQGETRQIADRYMRELPGRIAESVRLADASRQPARVSAGVGREDHLAFNRRFFMRDGTVGWNPGKLNPNIVKPAGPTDPEVPVIYFETPDGRPLVTYVNFAMHLDTVGGQQFSADYPYTLATLLGKLKTPDMLTLFTIGTAGNINHIDVSTKAPQKGHEEAARIGTVLAGEVLKTYTRLRPVAAGSIQSRREIVKLPLAPIHTAELDKARKIAARFGKPNSAPFMDLVWAFKTIGVAERDGKPIDAEVQVITLGDQLAWVGLPGEIFVELGMAIKKASPYPITVVAELANGSPGYVPNRDAYAQGAYEPVSARCAAGSGELLVETALRLLKSSAGR